MCEWEHWLALFLRYYHLRNRCLNRPPADKQGWEISHYVFSVNLLAVAQRHAVLLCSCSLSTRTERHVTITRWTVISQCSKQAFLRWHWGQSTGIANPGWRLSTYSVNLRTASARRTPTANDRRSIRKELLIYWLKIISRQLLFVYSDFRAMGSDPRVKYSLSRCRSVGNAKMGKVGFPRYSWFDENEKSVSIAMIYFRTELSFLWDCDEQTA